MVERGLHADRKRLRDDVLQPSALFGQDLGQLQDLFRAKSIHGSLDYLQIFERDPGLKWFSRDPRPAAPSPARTSLATGIALHHPAACLAMLGPSVD
jgi:hypothetical protein